MNCFLPPSGLSIRQRIDDLETPVSALLKLDPEQAGSLLFESVVGGEQRGRYSFIALRPDMWWRVKDGQAETAYTSSFDQIITSSDKPLEDLRAFVASSQTDVAMNLPPMAAGVFGYLGHDMIRYFETIGTANPDPLGIPEATLMRPTVVLIFDGIKQEIMLVAPIRPKESETLDQARTRSEDLLDEVEDCLNQQYVMRPKGGVPTQYTFTSNTDKSRYIEIVETAKDYIRSGEIFQVVPSQRFSTAFELPPIALYRALRRLNPSPFMFYINMGGFQIVGASPEILVRVRDRKVTIRPIAGTAPRGQNRPGAKRDEDTINAENLLADPKERAEHLMLLDLGRNDVGRVSEIGSVNVTQSFSIERYSHVMHIVSNVEGILREDKDCVSALMAGFPAGTVSGAPKIRAMQIIDELETHKRGIYAGAVGYIGLNNNMDTCIALRTALIKDGQLHVQAGGGVVFDSDPQKEFEETEHKAGAIFAAAKEAHHYV